MDEYEGEIMSSITIYHNPRCSKSRQTLALLEEHGVAPEVVEYLKEPVDAETLRAIVAKLGCSAHDIVRRKEAEYAVAGLSADSSEGDVIVALVQYPKLMERPIVVTAKGAAIGRPPENVLGLL